jgi:predicted molibdopterin-dependent oxidoreductase YjgC
MSSVVSATTSATEIPGDIVLGTRVAMPRRLVEFELNGAPVKVAEGDTILTACRSTGTDVPTLCYGDTIDPANACRVCMVEMEGSRTLVPACSRKVEAGMKITTDTPRTHHARKMVLEFLGSSVDLSTTPKVDGWMQDLGADPTRYGADAATVALQGVKIDNDLYVRDYGKCILCYKCVDACGEQWQNSFAIAVAGRGFDAHISTEFDVALPDSSCVYCGNCIAVCPTGALMFSTEHTMRKEGVWDEAQQTQTDTICPYCGVGCSLTLHVQDNTIVKVTSPQDHSVTSGNLCIKGRFGFQHVQNF